MVCFRSPAFPKIGQRFGPRTCITPFETWPSVHLVYCLLMHGFFSMHWRNPAKYVTQIDTVTCWCNKTNIHKKVPQTLEYIFTRCGLVTLPATVNNSLRPFRHHASIWTNADLLSIRLLGTNFSKHWMKIQRLSLKLCKMLAILLKPQCVLMDLPYLHNWSYAIFL